MSSDEQADRIFIFELWETVLVKDRNANNGGIYATVIALIFDGSAKYRLSWLVGNEVYETELPENRLAQVNPDEVGDDLDEQYEKLKPSPR